MMISNQKIGFRIVAGSNNRHIRRRIKNRTLSLCIFASSYYQSTNIKRNNNFNNNNNNNNIINNSNNNNNSNNSNNDNNSSQNSGQQFLIHDQRVKVYGIGTRGASAVDRLLEANIIQQDDACCLDANDQLLSQCLATNTLHLDFPDSDDSQLPPLNQQQLNQIQKSFTSSKYLPKNGVGFLISPSVGVPRGQDLIVQLLTTLKDSCEFVVIALTLPFKFEGPRKRRQSQDVLSEARRLADMVFILDQGVLETAPPDSPLTIKDVASISDTAFFQCVKSVLSSIDQPEVLSATRKALQWISRVDGTPLPLTVTSLLSSPGIASLARGMASVPTGKAVEDLGGLNQACERLAEDAVRGAGASPFLKNKLENATAVLCTLSSQSYELGDQTNQNGPGPKNTAVKLAMRAAAGMLRKIAGPQCNDVVVVWSKQHTQQNQQAYQSRLEIQIEATLVLLSVEDQEAKELFIQEEERNQQRGGTTKRRIRRRPSSSPNNYSAMSALAGGSSSAPIPPFLEKEKKFQLALPAISVQAIPLPKLPIPIPLWNLIKGAQMEGERARARRERERQQELDQLEDDKAVKAKGGFNAMLPENEKKKSTSNRSI